MNIPTGDNWKSWLSLKTNGETNDENTVAKLAETVSSCLSNEGREKKTLPTTTRATQQILLWSPSKKRFTEHFPFDLFHLGTSSSECERRTASRATSAIYCPLTCRLIRKKTKKKYKIGVCMCVCVFFFLLWLDLINRILKLNCRTIQSINHSIIHSTFRSLSFTLHHAFNLKILIIFLKLLLSSSIWTI